MADKLTISEALGWKKTLEGRHSELVQLRNANANVRMQRYGREEPEVIQKPEYDVKALDKRVTLLAREIRLVDEAIKRANAQTLTEFTRDEAVLGELE